MTEFPKYVYRNVDFEDSYGCCGCKLWPRAIVQCGLYINLTRAEVGVQINCSIQETNTPDRCPTMSYIKNITYYPFQIAIDADPVNNLDIKCTLHGKQQPNEIINTTSNQSLMCTCYVHAGSAIEMSTNIVVSAYPSMVVSSDYSHSKDQQMFLGQLFLSQYGSLNVIVIAALIIIGVVVVAFACEEQRGKWKDDRKEKERLHSIHAQTHMIADLSSKACKRTEHKHSNSAHSRSDEEDEENVSTLLRSGVP